MCIQVCNTESLQPHTAQPTSTSHAPASIAHDTALPSTVQALHTSKNILPGTNIIRPFSTAAPTTHTPKAFDTWIKKQPVPSTLQQFQQQPSETLSNRIRSIASTLASTKDSTSQPITAGHVTLTPRQAQHASAEHASSAATAELPLTLSDDPLTQAIETTIEQHPSVLVPWEPPIREHYEAFNYRQLKQRLHSAAL